MAKDIVKKPFRPAPGLVIVKPLEKKEIAASKGNFSVSENVKERDQLGEVIAVGEMLTTDYGAKISPPCEEGDQIVHRTYYAHPLEHDGVNYRFIKFQDVVAVFNE